MAIQCEWREAPDELGHQQRCTKDGNTKVEGTTLMFCPEHAAIIAENMRRWEKFLDSLKS